MSVETSEVNLVGDETVENIARTALFAAIMGAFAFVSFPNPFSPAPITLQVLGVFLAGILLGPIWGSVSMFLYLTAGGLGAPVFAGGASGIGVLLGPTGGYLWSYPIAAFIIGVIAFGGLTISDPHRINVPRLVGSMIIGTAIIYVFGIIGLMLVLKLGPVTAFLEGGAAFIPAEIFKIGAAVGIIKSDAVRVK